MSQPQGIPLNAYYYDRQLRRYILQFMAIFSGLQVSVGKRSTGDTITSTQCNGDVEHREVIAPERLISCPVHYGNADRVTAALIAENTQNKPLRLPAMSAYMRGLRFKTEYFSGLGTERREAYVPVGGLLPNDLRVIQQQKPTPFEMQMELGVYASNSDQLFQILEQILMLFTPKLQIQTSDGMFDMSKLTDVELTDILPEQQYPIMSDRRVMQTTLMFNMPVYLASPANIHRDIVEKIYLRIGAVDNSAVDSFEIVGQLDDLNIPYELWADGTAGTSTQNGD